MKCPNKDWLLRAVEQKVLHLTVALAHSRLLNRDYLDWLDYFLVNKN